MAAIRLRTKSAYDSLLNAVLETRKDLGKYGYQELSAWGRGGQ